MPEGAAPGADDSVVALPCAQVGGAWVSPTLALLAALGDRLGYAQPPRALKSLATRALHNLFDVQVFGCPSSPQQPPCPRLAPARNESTLPLPFSRTFFSFSVFVNENRYST